MAIIPIINKDSTELRQQISDTFQDPVAQRKIILVIVCIALLLDNMLYMVIVPIIPDYLLRIHALSHKTTVWVNSTHKVFVMKNNTNVSTVVTKGQFKTLWLHNDYEDTQVGVLFASKAILQLLVNPITGSIIDRIGYDIPMMIGLSIIFVSTIIFAFGKTYSVMFFARSLQGLGSAFADTSGLAMIADRFTEEAERTKALGIALAFISFGCLVAPPFGGILYGIASNKELPFICLALLALCDGFLLMSILKPARLKRRVEQAEGKLPKGTPIHVLLMDPYIAICAGALAMSNVSLAFLEPTIAKWMKQKMNAKEWQMGLVWLPSFFPHVFGVYITVKLAASHPKKQWLVAAIGLAIEGISCLFIPLCDNFIALMFPICSICFGIALVDTAILPTMGYLVDTRYVSIYGSVYAIADISYSMAYAIGPIVAGSLVSKIHFSGLNIAIFLSNVLYVPVMYFLRNIYAYKELEDVDSEGRPIEKDPSNPRQYMLTNGAQPDMKGSIDYNNGHFPQMTEKDGFIPEYSAAPPPRPGPPAFVPTYSDQGGQAPPYGAPQLQQPVYQQGGYQHGGEKSAEQIRQEGYGY